MASDPPSAVCGTVLRPLLLLYDVASDMVLNPKVGAVDYAGAAGGSVTGATDSTAGIVGAIREAVSGMNNQGGDIGIPVYLGGTMLDEVIVTAQQRTNLRSGGR